MNQQKENCKQLLAKAKMGGDLDKETKELFANLPDSLEELDIAIADCNRRAEALFIANPKVIEDYAARKKKIEALEAQVTEIMATLETENEKIQEIEGPWLENLSSLIDKISRKFSDYMKNISCAGEVRIHKEDDYDKWGVQILVKFRANQPLAILDSHRQSGGERSVATMLYLISLHDLTPCPFRVVDEINQGMDPVNERMIFQEVVKSACREGLPQYFLITPKLLTNLAYSKGVTVLCVFNGPWLISDFDAAKAKGLVPEAESSSD